MNLLYDSEVIASSAINIGVKTSIIGPEVDVRDCNGVLFILSGDSEGLSLETSGCFHLKASTASGGTYANYGSTVAVYSTHVAGIKRVWVLDAFKPTKPFLKACWYHSTGDMSLVSLKYGMRKAGSTHLRDTVGIDSAINISSS